MADFLRSRGGRLLVIAGIVLLVGAGLGTWLALRDDSSPRVITAAEPPPDPGPSRHKAFSALYNGAVVHQTHIAVLHRWPKPPYQTFRSGANQCYEWYDRPVALYTLCFKDGILTDKAIS